MTALDTVVLSVIAATSPIAVRRAKLVRLLADRPRTVGALARQLGVSKPTIERDLAVICETAGVELLPDARHRQRRRYRILATSSPMARNVARNGPLFGGRA